MRTNKTPTEKVRARQMRMMQMSYLKMGINLRRQEFKGLSEAAFKKAELREENKTTLIWNSRLDGTYYKHMADWDEETLRLRREIKAKEKVA